MTKPVTQNPKDRVVDNIPTDWTSEQTRIAREAAAILLRHYPGWAWGIEWTDVDHSTHKAPAILLRLNDLPTQFAYIIQYKDIDADGKCFMRGGGEFLDGHNLPRTKWKHDEVRGLKKTPAGLIVPYHAAVPDINPGAEFAGREATLT